MVAAALAFAAVAYVVVALRAAQVGREYNAEVAKRRALGK